MLTYHDNQFVTLSSVEHAWSDFAGNLCRLVQSAEVVLLDAPIPVRRLVHTALHRQIDAPCCWVVDAASTVTNIQEEIGAEASTIRHTRFTKEEVLVVDGMHRMGLRQQAELLRNATALSTIRVVILGGDTTDPITISWMAIGQWPGMHAWPGAGWVVPVLLRHGGWARGGYRWHEFLSMDGPSPLRAGAHIESRADNGVECDA